MRQKQFALCILAIACATGDLSARAPTESPLFQQWIARRTKFSFVGGRIMGTNDAWNFGVPQQLSADGPVHERINFNGSGVAGSLTYSYVRNGTKAGQENDPKIEFGVEISSEGRFVLSYSDKDHPERYFKFTQVPGQSVSLSLPPSDKPRVLKAPTLWHLLIINGDDCRNQFLPLLGTVYPDAHFGTAVQAAEDELIKMSAVSQKFDRKQWATWVTQLGDPNWSTRYHADCNLRDAGPAVLGYLSRLNLNQLDAEQQSRLRLIIRSLSTPTGDDTPEHVASMLVEDPLVWLALLSRPDESMRRAAARQLAILLSVPITIDPKADPASQAKARDELRTQIEKVAGEDSKPEDKSKPAVDSGKPSIPPPR